MGDKATLRMAQQELEDLYMGVPDESVDLTFKDLASTSSSLLPAVAVMETTIISSNSTPPQPHAAGRTSLARSSTNIFTYKPLEEDRHGGGGLLLQLPPSPPLPPPSSSAAVAGDRGSRRSAAAHNNHILSNYKQRPGIPHSNICALCNKSVYLFRHRCLVCGRVYCRRCVSSGMGDMTEGRKCIDCLGRRFSHRYIHRAGDTSGRCCLCFWGYYPSAKAVTEQELVWAEKGPAPRRHRRPAAGPSSMSTSSYASRGDYNSTNSIASASMSIAINSDNSMAFMNKNGNSIGGMPASASTSFVSASYAPNPHAFPL